MNKENNDFALYCINIKAHIQHHYPCLTIRKLLPSDNIMAIEEGNN